MGVVCPLVSKDITNIAKAVKKWKDVPEKEIMNVKIR
jgi:hypothetical protein